MYLSGLPGTGAPHSEARREDEERVGLLEWRAIEELQLPTAVCLWVEGGGSHQIGGRLAWRARVGEWQPPHAHEIVEKGQGGADEDKDYHRAVREPIHLQARCIKSRKS